MIIKFSPIEDFLYDIKYSFHGEIVEVEMNSITDNFDFTELEDGELDVLSIETDLPINPVLSAIKENGVLYIEVINKITKDASEFERFPNWIEVGEENGEI